MANEFETKKSPKAAPNKFAQDIYVMLHDLVYILVAVTVLFTLLIRLVTVSGPSMTSTLLDRDYVAVLSNVLYRDVKNGDVVVAKVPGFEDEPIVKRVIATQGQTVDITYDATGVGTVIVDGQALKEPYINEPMLEPGYATVSFPLTVPEGCVFVMGDNRNHSADSRYTQIGVFNTKYILGKVLLVVWPGRENTWQKRDFSRLGAVS
jgi:signal peptidase I